ncbi:hypothetical protein KIH74_01175 [Kineosporia sp. J2-2]|uniref:Uncharacterized protein n=1 Tax=Kineosporia corallincola TaxID=2835133 RepID=A0ABS5TD08_9ACTN|nr:hypothetical protein [Kineosporia corallincola]MBT0767514.1 hypothetical protein [Kineosporia corallincola]
MNSSSPISAFDRPRATATATSRSRSLSTSSRVRAAARRVRAGRCPDVVDQAAGAVLTPPR